ncbi:MAG: hypothetical protein ACR5LA_07315 [Wolbachia sp.]
MRSRRCYPSSPFLSSQCLTLGSRKIDCKQTHYTTFSIKSWIPASRTGMTPL